MTQNTRRGSKKAQLTETCFHARERMLQTICCSGAHSLEAATQLRTKFRKKNRNCTTMRVTLSWKRGQSDSILDADAWRQHLQSLHLNWSRNQRLLTCIEPHGNQAAKKKSRPACKERHESSTLSRMAKPYESENKGAIPTRCTPIRLRSFPNFLSSNPASLSCSIFKSTFRARLLCSWVRSGLL